MVVGRASHSAQVTSQVAGRRSHCNTPIYRWKDACSQSMLVKDWVQITLLFAACTLKRCNKRL